MTYVKEALAVTVGALAIGGSVVAILNGIKELRSQVTNYGIIKHGSAYILW